MARLNVSKWAADQKPGAAGGRFLVITINHSHAGFFAYVNFALNQLIYAEKYGLQPVVNFGPDSGDGPNAFYDASRGENIWDYFFEPVAGETYAGLEARIDDPDDPLTRDDLVTLDTEQLWRIHREEPESIFVYPHGIYRDQQIGEPWYRMQRAKANRIIDRYVRVKPNILAKVDAFAAHHFAGSRILGVHMRGTDKGTADAGPSLMRVVKPAEYFPHIDAYAEEHGACKVFVATDQEQFLDQMRARYGDRILSYQAIRARGVRNPFEMRDGNGYRKGEDVLIDCLLLSRCDYLLKCTSAVGEFAMYFNQNLSCTDLNHVERHMSIFERKAIRLKRSIYRRYLKTKSRKYLPANKS